MKTKAEIKCLCTVEASSFLVPCPWDSSGQEGHTRVRMRGNTVHSQLQGECDGQHAIASVATAFSQDGSKPAQGAVRDASQDFDSVRGASPVVGFWLETENDAGRRLRDMRPAIGFQADQIEIR